MNRFLKLFITALLFAGAGAYAQCPENIGFESGTLKNWKFYIGEVARTGVVTVDEINQPMPGRHDIVSASFEGVDPYGNFPTVSPNGSKYSVKLGNSGTGHEAERLSYTFVVPQLQEYSLILNYAMVLQNPDHGESEQPRFTVKVYDVANNREVDCPSFNFTASDNSPGFKVSDVVVEGVRPAAVFYKDWNTTTIDLSAYGGKEIRLEFTANDCAQNGHFGYAYFDLNEDCKNTVTGNVICEDQDFANLQGPKGFSEYRWFIASDMKNSIGNKQSLTLSPAPPIGTKYVLQVAAIAGLGCSGEFSTVITRAGEPFVFNVKPTIYFCPGTTFNLTAPQVTAGSSSNLLPFEYYTDDVTQEYLRNPDKITQPGVYYIKGANAAGCSNILRVELKWYDAVNFSTTNPAPVAYPATVDLSTTYTRDPSYQYLYYSDAKLTQPAADFRNISTNGKYYIKAITQQGCEKILSVDVIVNPPPPNIISGPTVFTPNNDGVNDLFYITIKGFVDFGTLNIYNRAGQFLFRASKQSTPWDGSFSGRSLPAGTYYWLFEGLDQYYHVKVIKSGYVSIIK